MVRYKLFLSSGQTPSESVWTTIDTSTKCSPTTTGDLQSWKSTMTGITIIMVIEKCYYESAKLFCIYFSSFF